MPGMTMAGGAGPRPTGVMPMQGQGAQGPQGVPQMSPWANAGPHLMGAFAGMPSQMVPNGLGAALGLPQGGRPVMGMGMGAPAYSSGMGYSPGMGYGSTMGQMPMNGGPPATSQQVPLFPGAAPGQTSVHQDQWGGGQPGQGGQWHGGDRSGMGGNMPRNRGDYGQPQGPGQPGQGGPREVPNNWQQNQQQPRQYGSQATAGMPAAAMQAWFANRGGGGQ